MGLSILRVFYFLLRITGNANGRPLMFVWQTNFRLHFDTIWVFFLSNPSKSMEELSLEAATRERSWAMTAVTMPQVREDRTIRLTKREIEVLSLVIEGKSSKEVAEELYVSKRTVDFHLANIYEKLQVSNRVQAYRRATSLGLIPLEPAEVRSK